MSKGDTLAFEMNSCLKNTNFLMIFHYVKISLWWNLMKRKRPSHLVKKLIRPFPSVANLWKFMKVLLTLMETMAVTKTV